ncbi:hypothetical protein WL76_17560 [Burkholderia ubonensis]|uniref:hypothetical protein n=1 Tax=Burkholderia ubonensis TaxID=101571 RepID=UPI00075F5AB2|nr:hypothetical protein [Burkholderia ubonensis]KWE51726.1 hypothetical protein WL76_17560 [Burkholderia ubonensis]KWE59983.1 hypothetical protein WL77_26820 [Burkholderia ubonensis]KWE79068.1 hypothetical protein WL79_04725 [Burkholderia ubonensis]
MAFLGNKRNVRTAHRGGAMTIGYFGTTAVWNPARFLRSRTSARAAWAAPAQPSSRCRSAAVANGYPMVSIRWRYLSI